MILFFYMVEGKIARITLNRPDKRNALNDAMIGGIKKALREVLGDEHVRAVVITGSGRIFCSGADLAALEKISKASVSENSDDANSLMELFLLIRQCNVPVTPQFVVVHWLADVVWLALVIWPREHVGAFWLSGSKDWLCAGNGASHPASEHFRKAGL